MVVDRHEAKRLDLLDLEAELTDRLFHLHGGLANTVMVSAGQRQQVLADLASIQPWCAAARKEFDLSGNDCGAFSSSCWC